MTLRFTPRAVRDLTDIADFLRQRNPDAALRVRSAILESLRTLTTFPEAGRRQTVNGVRKLIVRRYPYLIYYSLSDEDGIIAILTIRHAARERSYEDR